MGRLGAGLAVGVEGCVGSDIGRAAVATVEAGAAGISSTAPHAGHFPLRPAHSSGRLNWVPQEQWMLSIVRLVC
jgi:hypothetical protein